MGKSEILALQCFSCKHFSAQQRTKNGKWQCKRCGEKQSILKIFVVSYFASDIRKHIMNLNKIQGDGGNIQEYIQSILNVHQITNQNSNENDQQESNKIQYKIQTQTQTQTQNKIQNQNQNQNGYISTTNSITKSTSSLKTFSSISSALSKSNSISKEDFVIHKSDLNLKRSNNINFSEWEDSYQKRNVEECIYRNVNKISSEDEDDAIYVTNEDTISKRTNLKRNSPASNTITNNRKRIKLDDDSAKESIYSKFEITNVESHKQHEFKDIHKTNNTKTQKIENDYSSVSSQEEDEYLSDDAQDIMF